MPLKPWKLISSRRDRSFRIFDLSVDRAVSPRTNEAYDFFVLESMDWVNVIPLTPDGRVVLIRQYRHGIRQITLEIPGGIIEKADSPETAARRELREETGFQEAEMISLGWVHPNPAFLNNRCYTFIAKNAMPVGDQTQDEKEDIEVLLKPVSEVPGLIREGLITHSLVVAAFYRFYMEYQAGR